MDWVALTEIITFVVVIYILWRLVGRTLTTMLSQRSDRIEQGLRAAEENQRRAAEAQAESQRQLDQAQAEARAIMESAGKAAEAQGQALMAQAKLDADALVQRAQATIQRERQAAVDELRREAGRLAILAAGKIVSTSLDEQANRELADQAIADVEGSR